MDYKFDEDLKGEFITYMHNESRDKLNKALEIVKKYIIDNELMVVGGMSIDLALRLKGSSLYDENNIPDYDIISPNSVEHAHKIGELLCSFNEFNEIAIVPAVHLTTIRVQLLGFTIFDSTFVPKKLYDKIDYLTYNNIKFIHPFFQKINQFMSLSFLFSLVGPNYNICNRLKKDYERFLLLDSYYSMVDDKIELDSKFETIKITIPNNNLYFNGILSYNILFKYYNEILETNDIKPITNIIQPSIEITEYTDETEINAEVIPGLILSFVNTSNETDAIYDYYKKNKVVRHSNLLDYKPHHLFVKDINCEILDLFGRLISINRIENTVIVNYTYTLATILLEYYLSSNSDYLKYYTSLRRIISHVEELFDAGKLSKLEVLPFTLSVETNEEYDFNGFDESLYMTLFNHKYVIENKVNSDNIPRKNYLSHPRCEIKKTFDASKSEAYNDDYCLEIDHTNYKKIISDLYQQT